MTVSRIPRRPGGGRRTACAISFLVLAALAALTALGGQALGARPQRAGTAPSRIRVSRSDGAPAARIQPPGALTEFPGWGPCDPSGFCWDAGEPVVAVGPSYILETVNTVATVFSKSGTQLAQYDFAEFFGPKGISCGDPRALYIASVERYAFSCTGFGTGPMRFAISKTSDPTGEWYKYQAPNPEALDQDKIAAGTNKFVIAGNGSTEENSEWIYVYNLSELAAGASNPTIVKLLAKKSNLYEAAVEQSASTNVYMVASYPGNKLYLATITGTPAESNTAIKETEIKSTDFPAPSEPAVPGGTLGGGALDGRIYDAVYETETSDSKPVIAYSSARECGTRTCITAGKIDLSGTKPVLSSYTLAGEPGWDYIYGAVGMNAEGTMFEAYTRSNGSTAPGVGVLGPGFDVPIKAASAGTTSCESGQSEPCSERWGDYLSAAFDPSEPSSVWVSGLYQNTSGQYGWGSEIAKIATSTFSLPTATTGSASSVTTTSAKVAGTVNPNGVATKYHVDYGLTTGYEAASPEESAGSGTSAVPVSATLTGLKPLTTYHYRIVATTSTGNAVGADKTFKTKGPTIKAVKFTGTPSEPIVTVTGSSFTSLPAGEPACGNSENGLTFDSSLIFTDSTRGWTGGQSGDCIGLVVSTSTSIEIIFHFGARYKEYGQVTSGDSYTLTVEGVKKKGKVAYT